MCIPEKQLNWSHNIKLHCEFTIKNKQKLDTSIFLKG